MPEIPELRVPPEASLRRALGFAGEEDAFECLIEGV